MILPKHSAHSRRLRAALVAVVLSCAPGCHGRDAKALAVVQGELALLKPPVGLAPTDQAVGLGEMYAEGSQTYCVSDEKAGQIALDSMLRNAGWERLGSLSLEARQQECGRRFRVGVLGPL